MEKTMNECGQTHTTGTGPYNPNDTEIHRCWRQEGHYDDHICECVHDWAPGTGRAADKG